MAERTDTELLEFILPLADLQFIYYFPAYQIALVTALNRGLSGRELVNYAMNIYEQEIKRAAN